MNDNCPGRGSAKRSFIGSRTLKIVRGKLVVCACILAASVVFAVCLIAGSVWLENRYPGDDSKRALSPVLQKAVTQPIVQALGRHLENYFRRRSESVHMNTGMTLDQTIAGFLDERVPLIERRKYAYRLARVGSPECVAALRKVLDVAPPDQKAFIAQLIGTTGSPAARELLWALSKDADEPVARAALRGLSTMGGADVTSRFAEILAGQENERFRIEAAQGLAIIGTPEARDALVNALDGDLPDSTALQILDSLGRFDFHAVADVYSQFLSARDVPAERRVAALESLVNSSPESAPFLLQLAEFDPDADARAAAAWAISGFDTVHDLAPALAELAEKETDFDVRRRLYEALLPQDNIPAERLLPLVQSETDPAARIAGFNAIGRSVSQRPGAAAAAAFDRDIVPELRQIATQPNSVNLQMRAVFALRRAHTPAALTALAEIARVARPQVATAARNGLRRSDG